ncbi:MAG TPA: tetratricopeptide repeat protein [Chthoniobacterales bacterium]|nr:tetratricopeptide repeat protein [Chthoniobacterales bacterium]
MKIENFFVELKRRNVYKVAVAYAVVGWLLMQVATQVFPFLEIPNWVVRLVIALVMIGFPIALVIAWAFEATPEGIKRTEDVDLAATAKQPKKHAWIYVVVIGAAFSIGLFFVGRYSARNGSSGSELPAKSIAVLPFDNLSRDPDNAFFAEGVQDEILTRLAKVADLKVIARTSTQRFKSAPENLPQIAKQLGVMNVLEGSVQKANDQVRVNVQLINAMTETHLWAEIYDRKLTDIFAVESDIAKTIADTLQAKLTGNERSAMSHAPTEDPVAHELYLKGHHFWGLRGDNLPRAIEFYNQAIARDPNYALAYAGLGETYILLPYYTGADPKGVRPKARAATLKALELNPNLAEAHNAMGKILNADEIDLQKSIREYQRAIELSPNYAGAHHWLGNGPLAGLARFDEAIAEGMRSTELDPLSAINLIDLGVTYMYAHRLKEAEAEFKKALEIDSAFAYAHWMYGVMLQVSGDLDGARAQYATARARENDAQAIALRAQLGAKMGRHEDAVRALSTLEELAKHQYVEAYYRALLYISLGQKDQALAALEQSYAERDGDDIGVIKVDPLLDPLRGDPRFEALAQKVVAPKTPQ